MRRVLSVAALSLVAGFALGLVPIASHASSHREAPGIALDPAADITDFFFFRSYENGKDDKVVMIMDVMPTSEPSSGPTYFNFDANVLYSFHIDNNADGRADDIRFDVEFQNEFRGVSQSQGLFMNYVALPPITALDGAGSEGLGLRQKYSAWITRGGVRTLIAAGLIAVPSNVGPRTMPNYEGLAVQGVHDLGNGMRVFAGQRDDPSYVDVGALFDTFNLRSPGTDMRSGFSVQSIALEVPITMITRDGNPASATSQPVFGAYASTSRRRVTALRAGLGTPQTGGEWVQVQRVGNPLVNTIIIGMVDKDRWNAKSPHEEALFLDYYTDPRLVTVLEAVFGAQATPTNMVDLLLKYDSTSPLLSELLRLNVSVAPVTLASQRPLTVLVGDIAGWPNGHRPIDDVTDLLIQFIGGSNYSSAGDGVGANDRPLPSTFPFLPSPGDGRNRVHGNP